MAKFTPKKIDLSTINNGNEYNKGDGISSNAINDSIESAAYAQALATTQPDISEADNVGVPSVEIIEEDGLPKLKFKNIKGEKGDSGVASGTINSNTEGTSDTDGYTQQAVNKIASRPNLLINPDFSINQRGQESYSTQRQYTCDRWKLYSAAGTTYNASTKTFTVASGGYFWYEQYEEIDVVLLRGKSLTFTLSASGGIRRRISFGYKVDSTKTEIAGKDTTEASTKISVTGTVPNDATGIIFVRIQGFNTTGTITLEWAKLEIGSTATAFNPPLIAEELPKCQRYGLMLASGPVRYPNTQILDSTIDFTIPTPSSLRTSPTLSSTANIVVYNPDDNMAEQSGFTFEIVHTTSNAICIRAAKTAHGLTRAILGFTANCFLDAEL